MESPRPYPRIEPERRRPLAVEGVQAAGQVAVLVLVFAEALGHVDRMVMV